MKARKEIEEKVVKPQHFLQVSAAIIGKRRYSNRKMEPDTYYSRLN
jgi:hypothetical protein